MSEAPNSMPSDDPPFVETPASLGEDAPTVVVFGAGIAGLTAAHELAERGFKVTVYEPLVDVRTDKPQPLDVRLGGMAATQYVTPRPFPRPDGTTHSLAAPARATGEHGFRFFPAYYLHLWDMLQRIPVYDQLHTLEIARATPRSVYDNVERVITQAVAARDALPSLVLPREMPRSMAELSGAFGEILQLGFTQSDISTFLGRIMRFLVMSPERRAQELEEVSAYEFFVGTDSANSRPRYHYSRAFERQIRSMPKVLAAFDSVAGDARTNIGTYVQLNMALDRYDSKADGVLNGPTTEAWFDHWYVHLRRLGVEFEQKMLRGFTLEDGVLHAWVAPPSAGRLDDDLTFDPETGPAEDPSDAELLEPEPTYYVVATDAFRAEVATQPLRAHRDYAAVMGHLREVLTNTPSEIDRKRSLRAMSTVIGLDGWATSEPPANPRELNRMGSVRRNPLKLEQLGTTDCDRFQTLSGIQYFFDTEFQIVRGHVYFSDSEWSLSAINQSGFWLDKPNLAQPGYVSVMSVDIGDWNTASSTNKVARNCTRIELAEEVWRQVTVALVDSYSLELVAKQLPRPIWYTVDEFIVFKATGDHSGVTGANDTLEDFEKPRYNLAPYLIPRIGDWKNRPGAYPWNPQGTSNTVVPNAEMRELQKRLHVWQAGHGGYQVHNDKLVFAGTWCKTFTRMTSMEAACESGRHAVNAILDHYVCTRSEGTDSRDLPSLSWRMPFGFVDQELSSPIRQPTPAGDYAFIFDCENREPADARHTRALDSKYFRAGLAHPWLILGIDNASAISSSLSAHGPAVDPYASTLWMVDQVREWRKLVETAYAEPEDAPGPGHGPPESLADRDVPALIAGIDLWDRPPAQGGGGMSSPDPSGDLMKRLSSYRLW